MPNEIQTDQNLTIFNNPALEDLTDIERRIARAAKRLGTFTAMKAINLAFEEEPPYPDDPVAKKALKDPQIFSHILQRIVENDTAQGNEVSWRREPGRGTPRFTLLKQTIKEEAKVSEITEQLSLSSTSEKYLLSNSGQVSTERIGLDEQRQKTILGLISDSDRLSFNLLARRYAKVAGTDIYDAREVLTELIDKGLLVVVDNKGVKEVLQDGEGHMAKLTVEAQARADARDPERSRKRRMYRKRAFEKLKEEALSQNLPAPTNPETRRRRLLRNGSDKYANKGHQKSRRRTRAYRARVARRLNWDDYLPDEV